MSKVGMATTTYAYDNKIDDFYIEKWFLWFSVEAQYINVKYEMSSEQNYISYATAFWIQKYFIVYVHILCLILEIIFVKTVLYLSIWLICILCLSR